MMVFTADAGVGLLLESVGSCRSLFGIPKNLYSKGTKLALSQGMLQAFFGNRKCFPRGVPVTAVLLLRSLSSFLKGLLPFFQKLFNGNIWGRIGIWKRLSRSQMKP